MPLNLVTLRVDCVVSGSMALIISRWFLTRMWDCLLVHMNMLILFLDDCGIPNYVVSQSLWDYSCCISALIRFLSLHVLLQLKE